MAAIKHKIRSISDPISFFLVRAAAEEYKEGDPCDERLFQLMIRRFCSTNGKSQDELNRIQQKKRPIESPATARSILGEFSGVQLDKVVTDLENVGYYRFENKLPKEICDKLTDLALNATCGRNRPTPPGEPDTMKVDLENPITDTYHLPKKAMMDCPEIQRLIADEAFLAISARYFGCRPVFSSLSQWWSFPHPKGDTAQSAQEYHFDMDRIKWLKFFVYLTDVTPDNGAHYFVTGSHRTGNQPAELRQKNYVRISDEEIARHYPEESIVRMNGESGTMFVEDTRGYHKGNPMKTGHRLVLDLEYACSLFGGPFEKWEVRDPRMLLRTEHVRKHYADLYARCDFTD